MIEKFWSNFNIITRDHFYHSGGKIENRRSIVEALVCNFDHNKDIAKHNHGIKEKPKQLSIFELTNAKAQSPRHQLTYVKK
jgi:DNA adenine methylase